MQTKKIDNGYDLPSERDMYHLPPQPTMTPQEMENQIVMLRRDLLKMQARITELEINAGLGPR